MSLIRLITSSISDFFSAFKAGIARLLYLQPEDNKRPDDLTYVYQLIDDEADPLRVRFRVVGCGVDDDVDDEHCIEEPDNRIRCNRYR